MKQTSVQIHAELVKKDMCPICEHPREKTLDNEYICHSCGSIDEIPKSLRTIVIKHIEELTEDQEEDLKRMLKDAGLEFEVVNYTKTTKDFIFCETCQEFSDFWKYDSIEDTGHDKCSWRYVTEEELKGCMKDCIQDGCFNEE